MHEGPVLDTVDGIDVIDCETCNFAHVSPLPSIEAVKEYYETRYYQHAKPEYFKHAEEDDQWWNMVYHERLGEWERWLADDSRRTLLDVGSGPGGLILAAEARGWDAIGIEPNTAAYAYCQNRYGELTVYNRAFDDDAVETFNGFDVVHMGEVLEHVPDPAAFVTRAYRALKVGGYLCVIVPNDYSILQAAVRQTGVLPWWVVPGQHLNYFNVRSLHTLLRGCGFSIATVSTTFPMELFVLMGLNYVGDPVVGRQVHGFRKTLELHLHQLGLAQPMRDLYRAFGLRGIGRDIVMLARKPGAGIVPEEA